MEEGEVSKRAQTCERVPVCRWTLLSKITRTLE